MDITGHWKGHYIHDVVNTLDPTPAEQVACTIPFEAWFEVDGSSLTGRMVDLRTEMEVLYSKIIENRIEALKMLDQMKASSHVKKNPDCKYRITLCPESTVKGRVMGSDALFFKTHAGPCDFAFCYDSHEQITRYKDLEFHYHGKICEDGSLITGTFSYTHTKTAQPLFTFELRRVEESMVQSETPPEHELSAQEEIPSA